MKLIINQESSMLYSQVEEVIKRAFANIDISDKTEHHLVRRLRESEAFIPELSLVAINEESSQVVGHVLLTKAKILGEQLVETLALAPVSVLPEYQGRGIGTQLVKEALKKAKLNGFESVIVLGDPDYYTRFGFGKASNWGIECPWDVPDEVFMAMELKLSALKDSAGTVQYPKEFYH